VEIEVSAEPTKRSAVRIAKVIKDFTSNLLLLVEQNFNPQKSFSIRDKGYTRGMPISKNANFV